MVPGTLLTKGCNLKDSSMCFGESPASLGSKGLTLLIVGLLILCCPCLIWCCFFRISLVAQRRITQAQRKPPRINPWPSHHSRCNNREGICSHHKWHHNRLLMHSQRISNSRITSTAAAIRSTSTGYGSSICSVNDGLSLKDVQQRGET